MNAPRRAQPQLAVDTYLNAQGTLDSAGALGLAWTSDERAHLALNVEELVALALRREADLGLPEVYRYAVHDPYGSSASAPVLSAYFGVEIAPDSVFCGAGVAGLLAAIAPMAELGNACLLGALYPDFLVWLRRAGARYEWLADLELEGSHHSRLEAAGASLVFLERPALLGSKLDELSAVNELCGAAAACGAVVVIDESNANYCAPSFSAARLTGEVDNLIVLRGMSKAFGLGGLRVAWAIASPALHARLRALIAPLQVSSLSIALAAALLERGDICAPLRARLGECKARARPWVERAQIPGKMLENARLPYFLFEDAPSAKAAFEVRGIIGKMHPVWTHPGEDVAWLYRLSVPLDEHRLLLFHAKLTELVQPR